MRKGELPGGVIDRKGGLDERKRGDLSVVIGNLAGRLAGLPRVGLGPLVVQLLGLSLEKGHGAADWSRRP